MKRILLALSITVFCFLLYYLFIRPFEFEVNFKAKTLPGDLIETIRIWNRTLKSDEIIEVQSLIRLKQSIIRENRRYIYNWRFNVVHDSLTNVSIQISEPDKSIINKLLIPFTEQPIETDARDIANTFYKILKEHLDITSVKTTGETQLDSAFCVCRSLETNQIDKANGMMRDYGILTSFIDSHNLKTDGSPMVRVKEWDHEQGKLKFDFCFPIHRAELLPSSDSITYSSFKKLAVLKAEYRGNYITSDRAWYSLLRYAETNGYKVKTTPIEYFHNNPNLGMNEANWKADIYLPIDTD
jgi:hypothetical protein